MGTERVLFACGCIASEKWCSGGDAVCRLPHPCTGCEPFHRAQRKVFAEHAELFRRLAEIEMEDDRDRLLSEVFD